ncbi:helix-turn-helix domain-containing protein [Lactiplantibacillus plantarum]|uniref:helix-turn-helix domain-containing protein n=1 Tax=Lactiplantibacillus plantarum TaxID=1590 RepID=UPI0009785BA1|nr:Rgg/GadR/MutR family transcriptional regulator [Lactiplantibacillus plantarum]MDN3985673.1 helix-turn-helix domain-containing protein [Lactiplantibacillus plantarum]QBK74779.1 Rgg/GadR/MutR family transcriptional regulator [Lactiplantibacillus plantarum]
MKNFGSVIREVRKSKALTLKQVAGSELSVAFLSKVERGNSDISLNNFLIVLKTLNISWDEFFYVAHGYQGGSRLKFIENVKKYILEDNVYGLQRLQSIEAKTCNHNSKYHHFNVIIIDLIISQIQHKQFKKEYVTELQTYLLNVENWGIYELTLFNNVMFCFPTSVLRLLLDNATKKTIAYRHLPQYEELLMIIICNNLEITLQQKNIVRAEKIVAQFTEIYRDKRISLSNMKFKFLQGILMMYTGNVDAGKKLVVGVIDACYVLGDDEQANSFEKYLNESTNFEI